MYSILKGSRTGPLGSRFPQESAMVPVSHIPGSSPGMSRTKTLCKVPFSIVLDREWSDLGWDVLGSEKLYARKLWGVFSFSS